MSHCGSALRTLLWHTIVVSKVSVLGGFPGIFCVALRTFDSDEAPDFSW